MPKAEMITDGYRCRGHLSGGSGGREDVVKLLLATGKVDAESKDDRGQTPLLWAAE